MSKYAIFLAFMLCARALYAQQLIELEENTPYNDNGLVYGYYISNEKAKEVKGDDYDRYEINLYVMNKSGSIKLIPFNSVSPETEEEVAVAEFTCRNATGKRLTSKNGKVNAKPWFTQVKVKDETQNNKYKFINAQAGFAIKNGQTITTKIVVIVPKGEKPAITCHIFEEPG